MINENELKIGNKIFHNGNIETITRVEGNNYCTEEYGHGVYEVDPIPLTPEILEKAGFENKRLNNFFFLGNGDLVIEGFEHDYNGIYIGKIEYLHQLQNIYFWLTGGEELQINL